MEKGRECYPKKYGDIVNYTASDDQFLLKHELSKNQYGEGGSSELLARWSVYELAKHPRSIHDEIALEVSDAVNDTVVDVGCGTGFLLKNLRVKYHHKGKLIGIDPYSIMFSYTKKELATLNAPSIDFIVGDAEYIPLPNSSADTSMALFMLYHVPNVSYALNELKRITKPSGKIIVATSGDKNKLRHREFELDIASFLKVKGASNFTSTFDADVARETLNQFFNITKHVEQDDSMIVKRENYPYYINSLLSMRRSFKPEVPIQDWEQAINLLVRPIILNEIKTKGYFTDYIDRHYWVCENNK